MTTNYYIGLSRGNMELGGSGNVTVGTSSTTTLDVEIRNFDITSTEGWGIFLDAGCCGYSIHDGVLRGLNGIAEPANLAIPAKPNVIDWSTIDFEGTGTKHEVHQNPIG